MLQKLLVLILLLSLCPLAGAQIKDEKPLQNPDEKAAKTRTQAVAFLREAMAEANNLRSLENRISFSSELAGLMWYHDDKEAKSMFTGVISDFRELLMSYDAQMNAFGMVTDDGDQMGGFLGDIGEPSKLNRKFMIATGVRQQIATSLAEHDAETAFNFLYDSRSAVSNPEFRKQLDGRDKYFETKLIMMAIDGKSPKAMKFAERSLENGFNSQHVDLLKRIVAKDAEKGADFGAAILNKIKSDKIKSEDFYAASSLLYFGDANLTASKTDGKRSVYSQADLREIADIFAQSILSANNGGGSGAMQFVGGIEKYAPSRGVQLRAKFGRLASNSNSSSIAFGRDNFNRAATNTGGHGDGDGELEISGVNMNSANTNSARQSEREAREKTEEKMMQEVMSLGGKELPKEQREKIITASRKIIAATPGREKKITAFSLLAGHVAAAGDNDLAADIMRDASSLVNTNPKNYQDFILTWLLATGYAAADPAKTFPLLEDTIARANVTIDAFVKVAEFIDISGEMVNDGEVQVGAFGGSMLRGMTGELGMADSTIKLLAQADFTKTSELANKFDRAEVRMLAKMMVLRAVLNDTKPTAADQLN